MDFHLVTNTVLTTKVIVLRIKEEWNFPRDGAILSTIFKIFSSHEKHLTKVSVQQSFKDFITSLALWKFEKLTVQLLPSVTGLYVDLRSTRDVGYSNASANGDEFALAHALTNPLPFHTQQNQRFTNTGENSSLLLKNQPKVILLQCGVCVQW